MRFTSTLNKLLMPVMAFSAILLLTSCGAYQYVGYDNDGIYNSGRVAVVEVEEAANSRVDSEVYADYFAEQAIDAQIAREESDIFTDIDSYSSDYVEDDLVEVPGNYGGWGQVNDQVIVNVYGNSWNGWNWNSPWFWGGSNGWAGFGWAGYGPDWGFGWNRWNRWGGWGLGWGGFGPNWGWNNPWLWNGGFGWGWNNWGWNNGFYRNNRLAFNSGRRGVIGDRSLAQLSSRNLSNSRSTLSNGRRIRNGNTSSTRVRRGTIGSRSRTATSIRRGTYTRTTNGTRVGRSYNRRGLSNGTVRRSSSSNGSRGTVRRSSSSNRNRGTVRRSSSSNRSRGTVNRSSSSSSRVRGISGGSSRSSGVRSGGSRSSSSGSRSGGSRGGRRG